MQQRTCTIDGCDKPYRARGLCASHWNAAYRKDQHREVPCTICGTLVIKNAPGLKRRPVCSTRCRTEMRRLDAPPPKPSVPFDRASHARAQRSPIRAALEDGDHSALLAAILADCTEGPAGCWQWTRGDEGWIPHRHHRWTTALCTSPGTGSSDAAITRKSTGAPHLCEHGLR